uniref:universal stress protein A-like protein n=1 Tax=Erigeron canadensis TaxID=72917 RepID=UPI001CB8C0A0|nr:universal stress protein A-like protein [Erigeron canadensis]
METETSDDGNRRNTTVAPPPIPAEGRQKKRLTVMVAVDESDRSLYALKWTLENLFKVHVHVPGEENPEVEPDPEQGLITIVHVMEPFERYTFPAEPSMYTSASMVESVRKAQRENAAQLLSRAFEVCKGTKIKAETLILEGDPKEMLCQAVEQMHFDLLVVGSRGLGAIKRAFLGSISDFCAHHAKCPVLIVKPSNK